MNRMLRNVLSGAVVAFAFAALPASAQMMNKEKTVQVGGAAMFPSKNIIQNAVNSKDHTTLVSPQIHVSGDELAAMSTRAARPDLRTGWVMETRRPDPNSQTRNAYRRFRKAGIPAARARWIVTDLLSAGHFSEPAYGDQPAAAGS